MTALDYEAEYNNRARVPDHQEIFSRWMRESEDYRRTLRQARRADIGLSYGTTARQTIDLFLPEDGATERLALFIHGGYWRSLEPSIFSNMARGLNARGVAVAVSGYDLCPQVSIAEIIRQTQQACLFLWWRFGQRILVYGHSAGGHLAACMTATDWPALDSSLPSDLVPAAMAISGVFDLEPLVGISMNAELRLDAAEARRVSPLFWPVEPGRTLDAVVGGAESSEFLRQSRIIADGWGARGVTTAYQEVPGANHFTVLNPLTDPGSAMVGRLATLAQQLG